MRTSSLRALLLVAVGAPALANEPQVAPIGTVTTAIPDSYVTGGIYHRLLIDPTDSALRVIERLDAAVAVEHYGSFLLVVVDETKLGGRDGLKALGVAVADHLGLVNTNGYQLDGADPVATAKTIATIPLDLRQTTAPPADGESRLWMVQFIGPVKDEWLGALEATGAHVVTYMPNDAYVVKADPVANANLDQLASFPFVLAKHAYHPAMKLRPELRPPYINEAATYDVIAQVIADAEGVAFANGMANNGYTVLREPEAILAYLNVTLRVSGAQALDLARDARVFAVEPVLTPALMRYDERQGQIQAGNVNAAGTQPSATGYFAWLQGKGFPGAGQDPFDFVVDVVDDGVDNGNTTTVNTEFKVGGVSGGASRLVYNNNYTSDATANGIAGHGNINASIIGGYNTLTGTAYEDTSLYNYGLGIAPWVKLGNSKVFDNAGGGDFNQPTATRLANAYNGGARISSNSWGYTSGTTYNTDSQAHDRSVRDALSATAGNQEMSIIFAAGNSGPGASTVHPPGTAKNIITVGASENYRMTGSDGCGIANSGADNAMDIISFSSRGPTSDGRKKPELVSVGTHVQGAASIAAGYNGTGVCNQYWPAGQTLYAWSSGTSHSTPAVAGAAALVRRYAGILGEATPSPAMTKACLVNTTRYLTGVSANDTLWSNNQGFGRVDLGRSFDTTSKIKVDQTTVLGTTGQTHTVSGTIATSTQPFRVTLTYTDAPGPTTGNATVNNLDLEVTLNGTLYRGNVFSGANSIAGGVADAKNNTECVFFPAGTTGSFSIVVRGTNIAGDGVPGNADTTDQDFALHVYNGTAGTPTPDYSVSATPSSQTITQGSSTSYTVNVTGVNGWASAVALSASPAISGVTYSFTPTSVTGSGSSTLSVTTTASATVGTHNITITGTSGATTRTTNVSLTINATGGGGSVVKTASAAPNAAIPDNNATGVTSTVNVTNSLTITSVSVTTAITHPYKGDLVVTLTGPDGTSAILHNRSGASADNVTTTFAIATTPAQSLTVFNGKNTAGNWSLKVQDLAAADVGTFNSWSVTFNGEKAITANLAVPDNNTTGVTSTQTFTATGTVASVRVRCNVTHTYQGDLEIALIGPDNTTVLLHNRTGGATDNVNTEYPDLTAPAQSLSAFTGKAIAGAWKLRVRDLAAGDTGTLVNWTVSFTAQ
jgi:subtilisin-like proprotein convertase family protein